VTIAARVARGCAIIAVATSVARAQQRAQSVAELDHAVWTIRDGAPTGVVALAQSADGMLWIGTTTGLYQFDGVKFEPFEAPPGVALPGLSVNALLALPDGKVWVGYSRGGASVLAGGRFVSYGQRDGMPVGTVTAFAVDSSGNIWAATTTGLARFRDDRWQRIGPESGYPSGGMTSDLLVDRRGTLWAATSSGVLVLVRGGSQFVEQAPSLDPTGSGGGVPREAPDGSVWGASLTLGLTRLADSAGGPTPTRAEADRLREAWGLIVDRHANAWVMERLGLVRVPLAIRSDRGEQIGIHQPLPVTRVAVGNGARPNVLLEDREGNVWVGTNAGLDRFRETKLTPVIFPVPVSLPSLAAGERGSVWVGGEPDLFRVGDSVAVHRGGPNDISCAYRDSRGGVWLAGRAGMWYASPDGASLGVRFSRVALPAEAETGEVQAIAQSLDGDLWISVRSDLARAVFQRRGGVWSRFSGPAELLPDQYAQTIVTDSAGRIWLGYQQNRVVLVTGDSSRIYSEADGLQVGAVTAISVRGNDVWVGGESGLMILEGERFRSIDATVRLRAITGIVEPVNGDLWLHGAGGVTHIESGELRRALAAPGYRARAERFDYHDGLNGQAPQVRPFPTAIEGTDGRLWFATESGVAWLDPTNIKRNRLPPPVQIRALSAGGRRYGPGKRIALPAGITDLQIAYTASSLTMPDRVRFRYRLAGADTAWQEPSGRREAYYTNLRPGSYRFQVVAANEDDIWNEAGASIEFDIPPTFTQTKAFIVLCVATAVIVALLLAQWRQRRMARVIRTEFEATLAERARVARELHDTLLGDMAGVAMQLSAGARVPRRATEPTLRWASYSRT
jgi:ligand-binding sensor domain-containing protein